MDGGHQTGSGNISIQSVLGVLTNLQTYKNVFYLLLAFPLGMLYFMLLLFGFVFGTVFAFFLVGIAILVATILGGRILGGFERWLANALLAVSITPPSDLNRQPNDGTIMQVRRYIDAPSTWRSLGFLLLKFWAGILGFILVFSLVSAVQLVTAPVHYPHFVELVTVNDEPVGWNISTLEESLLAVPIGLGITVILLYVSNVVAYVLGQSASALLGGNEQPTHEYQEVSQPPTSRPPGGQPPHGQQHPRRQSGDPERTPQQQPTRRPQPDDTHVPNRHTDE